MNIFLKQKTASLNLSYGQLNLFDVIENKILKEDPAVYRKEIEILLEQQNEEEIFLVVVCSKEKSQKYIAIPAVSQG